MWDTVFFTEAHHWTLAERLSITRPISQSTPLQLFAFITAPGFLWISSVHNAADFASKYRLIYLSEPPENSDGPHLGRQGHVQCGSAIAEFKSIPAGTASPKASLHKELNNGTPSQIRCVDLRLPVNWFGAFWLGRKGTLVSKQG